MSFADLEAQYLRAPSGRAAKRIREKARAAAGKLGIAPPLWARVTKAKPKPVT
ncbi:MAG: hypothetical protein WDO69_22720 [Pseudomonadota bacterium]